MTLIAFSNDKYDGFFKNQKIEVQGLSGDTDDKIIAASNELKNFENLHAILIPCSLTNVHTNYSGIKLGMHIRLNEALGKKRFLPILFLSFDDYETISKFDQYGFADYLLTKGNKLCHFKDRQGLEDTIEKMNKFDLRKTEEGLELELREELKRKIRLVLPNEYGRHSIANDWGAMRLAKLSGTNPFHLPEQNNIFLKYKSFLTSGNSSNENITSEKNQITKWKNFLDSNKNLKILFIDDLAFEKNWNKIIENIFCCEATETEVIAIDNLGDANNKINEGIDKFDIIIIDLRLNDKDEKVNFIIDDPSELSGGHLMKLCKEKNPSVPVMIFTASNKTWIFKKLFDHGADGIYIKESPELDINDEYSKKSYNELIDDFEKLITKGKELKWYWKNSENIKKVLEKNRFGGESKARQRIEEKLKIAFGFLRSPQTSFDKKFLFTDYELAFLAYWSILNEFIEVVYVKPDKGNNTEGEKCKELKLKKSDVNIIKEGKSNLIRITNSNASEKYLEFFPWLKKNKEKIQMNTYKKSLIYDQDFYQQRDISFRIPAYILNYFEDQSICDKFNEDFTILNDYRNKLDYTHSNSHSIKYESIYDRNVERAQKFCQLMFTFIYFLLANDEIDFLN